ncbi:hypothetical protein FB45DRAFT_1044376 [Roridomyces roridus]|uniref:Uncharacterized protein n=1 Tax=Roridomyces roridus TaxID=1738132 RepID=A0AAD7F7Y7_9AGAR|nr:hypothetical protein FB45DRAFT_1044376 [Roridomyces roridus]
MLPKFLPSTKMKKILIPREAAAMGSPSRYHARAIGISCDGSVSVHGIVVDVIDGRGLKASQPIVLRETEARPEFREGDAPSDETTYGLKGLDNDLRASDPHLEDPGAQFTPHIGAFSLGGYRPLTAAPFLVSEAPMPRTYTRAYCQRQMDRAIRKPYAREAPGSLYVVARVRRVDLEAFCNDAMTTPGFRARLMLKLGMMKAGRLQKRMREYHVCDGSENVHIWMGHWTVPLRYLYERLMHLSMFWDGAERTHGQCVCGVHHREFVSFSSLAGLTRLDALMTSISTFFEHQVQIDWFPRPKTPNEALMYDLVRKS